MIIKIHHNTWSDNVSLDFKNNRLKRINVEDEYGNFKIINSILLIC